VVTKILNYIAHPETKRNTPRKGGDKNGRKQTKLWLWLYRAKTGKHKTKNRRKKAQEIQVTHARESDAGKGRGAQDISSAFPPLPIDNPEGK